MKNEKGGEKMPTIHRLIEVCCRTARVSNIAEFTGISPRHAVLAEKILEKGWRSVPPDRVRAGAGTRIEISRALYGKFLEELKELPSEEPNGSQRR